VIPLAWSEVEALELGDLRGRPADGVLRRVHDDSRVAAPGDLFVALNTGVRYVDQAHAAGAATLVPRDQEAALATLARRVRDRADAQVVAVVGSTGKTTTKDALASLCGGVTPTVAAEASRNNELGLPLTVLRLEPDTKVLVAEMGMRSLGQIAALCDVARPTLSLVTSIGPEHLELVGTVADVARANAEAIAALPAGGVAVVPGDEPLLEPYLRDDLDVRRFERGSVERDGDAWVFPVGAGRFGSSFRSRSAISPRTSSQRSPPTTRSVSLSTARGTVPPRSASAGGAARCRSFRAAVSSSTTPTTRTRSRCGQPSSIS